MIRPKWSGGYGKFPILMINPFKLGEIKSLSWYLVFGTSLANITAYKKISGVVSYF
jgi:hypothetical protein